MEIPKCLRDRFNVQHSIFSLLSPELREALVELIPIDHPIDHHMAHMNTLRSDFSGETRRQSAKTSLGRGKGREGRSGTQRRCGPRKEDAPATLGDHPP